MGASRDNFIKYPRTPHPFGSNGTDDDRHRDFAFNATTLTAQLRKRWIDLFADYHARVEIVYLEPPVASILKQNRERPASVPESFIRRLIAKIEVPSLAEGHAVTFLG